MTQQAPHHIGVIRQLTLPWTWCSGSTCSSTSLLDHDHRSSMATICACKLPYVWTTPCKHQHSPCSEIHQVICKLCTNTHSSF